MMKELFQIFIDRREFFTELTLEHLWISGIALIIAGFIGLLLGIWISQYRKISPYVLAFTNLVYTIPSIALFGFLIPLSGIGDTTAIIALTIYALLPMVRNTFTGITEINPDLIEAATAMGCSRWQLLIRIKLPLAFPVILTGVRTMIIMTIALTGIAAFIGAGGLGVAIYRGITTNNITLTIAGSILIALLALLCDWLTGRYEHHIRKKRHMK